MRPEEEIGRAEAIAAARTEALYREVNERIAESAARFEAAEAEFVCECSDGACTHRVAAPLERYEEVRSEGTRFILAPGHEDARFERVVARAGSYEIVEKVHRLVAWTVRRLDPRTV
jgi:hypothetical protein